jgi:uncharacterized protein YfaS (alpha-2-macroglobulin family)
VPPRNRRFRGPTVITSIARFVAGLALAAGLTGVAMHEQAKGPRGGRWIKVDEAVNKGLPKTAVQELEPIIRSALADKAYPEAVKAIAKKIALEGAIEGNKPEERIPRLKAAIATAPPEVAPVMDALLAHWHWHYFQQNRWRFVQRTATTAAPGEDFTTWDLPRLFAAIDAQFAKALTAEKELQAIPVGTYDALLEKGTLPDRYRPTLWDFLVHEALSYYSSGEQAGAKVQDEFVLDADGPAFVPTEQFLKWQPPADALTPLVKALRLYQQLLTFHQADADRSAYADADLARLRFGHNHAVGVEKNTRYAAALKAFCAQWSGHEISAMARHQWAESLRAEGNMVEARDVALAGAAAFPDSAGGKLCRNTIAGIEAKSASAVTERVWGDPAPVIRVTYRNVTKVYFRLVAADYVKRLQSERYRPDQLTDADRKALLAARPAAAFSHDLPPTPDYRERSEDVPAPRGLPAGYYFLFASFDPDFDESDNVVSGCDLWVTRLALVTRQSWGPGRLEGFVLDNATGEPIAGAEVRAWRHDGRGRTWKWVVDETARTDAAGRFRIQGQLNSNYLLLAAHAGQLLAAGEERYLYNDHRGQPHTDRLAFFTDRALYRPGQTIQFKGIVLRADQSTDTYETLAGREVTVVFADVNGQIIATQQVRSNDYGSFSGSFVAPRDRLTGRMTIRGEHPFPGGTQVSVEEYKRPKFLVTLDAPKDPPKLNAAATLQGKALSYTGVPIAGAKVRYRVARDVRFPGWWYDCFWWRPAPAGDAQEIAHGTATTDADGNFTVTFTARPDPGVPEKEDPSFRYSVSADVTDTTGETRSASRTIEIGYTALRASLSSTDWQTPDQDVTFTIGTTTLDGDGQSAKGTIRVYRLKEPERVQRPDILNAVQPRRRGASNGNPSPDPADPRSWETGEQAATASFETNAAGTATVAVRLPAGPYRAVLESQDRFDKPVTTRLQLFVLDPAATKFSVKVPNHVAAPRWSVEPGQEFMALWGTGYDRGRAFIEIERGGEVVKSFWTDPAVTQAAVKLPVTEAMRGGFTLRVTYIRENRAFVTSRFVNVPWSNKELTIAWEHFTSKLEPGKKETWTAVVKGPGAKAAAAEMVASLYDASLDQFLPHDWHRHLNVFRQDRPRVVVHFENGGRNLNHLMGQWADRQKSVAVSYRAFPDDLTTNMWSYEFRFRRMAPGAAMGAGGGRPAPAAAPSGEMLASLDRAENKTDAGANKLREDGGGEGPNKLPAGDLAQVAARTNLAETAFFFPHLNASDDGTVRITFTMPETLTKWKFLGFAHDTKLRTGGLTAEAVTSKDLMVVPNPPRFLREGDRVAFTVKVSNKSDARQAGRAKLTFGDLGERNVDSLLGPSSSEQPFELAAGESKTFAWTINVPDGIGPVTYKAVAATDTASDGEEGAIPVLSRYVFVTESLPLPIRGEGTKTFDFVKLRESVKSDTLKHQSLTVQAVSQPAWYAVMALPYLMEFPYECTEQTFNRLYANALARHVANSDPKIRRVFDAWRNTPALDSPLEKNLELKAAVLEETPWVRQAQAESQARRNVGILFDANRLDEETRRLIYKLAEQQNGDGSWPWFPGGPRNDYITLYITTGFGRLKHLGVRLDMAVAGKALNRLDAWIDELYQSAQKHKPEQNHLSPTIALYLYGRSFFLTDAPLPAQFKPAVDYWLGQAKQYWLQLANRQSQAHLALALHRFGAAAAAKGIMASIKERSVSNEELGMFWRDTELSWWWYRAPIETQAMMVEAFDEVMADKRAVEDCKVWLLKQKQTQDWKTTKATADAVYALMIRGENLLGSDALLQVSLAGRPVKPEKVEPGTGFYEVRFAKAEVAPEMGAVTVTKTDGGVSWASVHWQYLEDLSKVTPHEGTPLKLEKKLFKRVYTKTGPVLEPVAGPLAVGDELVTRVVLRTDRDMEYIHLKDARGSGTEPVNVLSRYRFQDGLAYYESTKDTASHFFIDYLPKGTYVFEYAVRVQLKGSYATGLAEIQCMYAPEFNSHSESVRLEVR